MYKLGRQRTGLENMCDGIFDKMKNIGTKRKVVAEE